MKKIFFFIVCFLILIGFAYSSVIDVGVVEEIKGNVSSITYDNYSNIVKFSIEFYNTGSVPYKARIKNEIYNDSKLIFNGWSIEKNFTPGERNSFDIYWYTNYSGRYSSKLKAYFGNEIREYKEFDFLINKSILPEDVFEIKNLRTYDDYIIFDVESKEDVKNAIAIPNKYVSGWVFEQKKIGNITKDGLKLVVLPYHPTLWMPNNITLAIVSDNGKYFTEKTVEMKKNEGLAWLFYYIVDSMRMTLFK